MRCENQWTADGRCLLVGGLKDGLYTGYLMVQDGSQLRHVPRITHILLSPVEPCLPVQTALPSGAPRFWVLDVPSGAGAWASARAKSGWRTVGWPW